MSKNVMRYLFSHFDPSINSGLSASEVFQTPNAIYEEMLACAVRAKYFLYFHFADLNCRLNIGVVWDISRNSLSVCPKSRLKYLYRIEI
jgi:hypothetical protein